MRYILNQRICRTFSFPEIFTKTTHCFSQKGVDLEFAPGDKLLSVLETTLDTETRKRILPPRSQPLRCLTPTKNKVNKGVFQNAANPIQTHFHITIVRYPDSLPSGRLLRRRYPPLTRPIPRPPGAQPTRPLPSRNPRSPKPRSRRPTPPKRTPHPPPKRTAARSSFTTRPAATPKPSRATSRKPWARTPSRSPRRSLTRTPTLTGRTTKAASAVNTRTKACARWS